MTALFLNKKPTRSKRGIFTIHCEFHRWTATEAFLEGLKEKGIVTNVLWWSGYRFKEGHIYFHKKHQKRLYSALITYMRMTQ